MLIDVDHFKRSTTDMGTPCGDTVLKAVASELKRYVREGHLVARIAKEGGRNRVVQYPYCPMSARGAESVRGG